MGFDAYLVRRRKPTVAHLWNGTDTACRMASTGGLNPDSYYVADDPQGRRICDLCSAVQCPKGRPARSLQEALQEALAEWPDFRRRFARSLAVLEAEAGDNQAAKILAAWFRDFAVDVDRDDRGKPSPDVS